ncbi:GATA zinc finger domain-containing protein 14-like, partial [Centruroides sculpturatus]|uniref:GATA zinc finger domain-containing protein 14-like n=1 Tax=Centruroides sculpturatus TaxID=218467 RepID=UPI000C6CB4A9
NSLERDVLRERQARQRAELLEKIHETPPQPIFSEPIKVDPSLEDETTRRIKSTLGDFNQVQHYLVTDPKHLIGISRSGLISSHNNGNNSSSGQQHTTTKDGVWTHSNRKLGLVNGQNKVSHKSGNHEERKHSNNNKYKSKNSYQTVNENKSKQKVQIDSHEADKSFDKGINNKHKTTKSSAFPNTEKTLTDDLCKERLGNATSVEVQNKTENISKQTNVDQNDSGNEKLQQIENILQEMKVPIPTLLTAICTPEREETSFHFSSIEERNIYSKNVADQNAVIEQNTDSTHSLFNLREDLEVSESDDEMEHDLTRTNSVLNSVLSSPNFDILHPPPPIGAMSSSTKSSDESEMSELEFEETGNSPANSILDHSLKNSEDWHIESSFGNDCNNTLQRSKDTAEVLNQQNRDGEKENTINTDETKRKFFDKEVTKSSYQLPDFEGTAAQQKLFICSPIHSVCGSPVSISNSFEESKISNRNQYNQVESVHTDSKSTKTKKPKKRRKDVGSSNHFSEDLYDNSCRNESTWSVSNSVKTAVEETGSLENLSNVTVGDIILSDPIQTHNEKFKKHKLKKEKSNKKMKKEKGSKLTGNLTTKESKRSSTKKIDQNNKLAKDLPKLEEQKASKESENSIKKKGKLQKFKSKEFILDSPNDSDSDNSNIEKPLPPSSSSYNINNSPFKTSLTDSENFSGKYNKGKSKSEKQNYDNHSDTSQNELIRGLTSEEITDKLTNFDNLSSKNVAVVKPIRIGITNSEMLSNPEKYQNQENKNSVVVSIDLKLIDRLPSSEKKTQEKKSKLENSHINLSNEYNEYQQTEHHTSIKNECIKDVIQNDCSSLKNNKVEVNKTSGKRKKDEDKLKSKKQKIIEKSSSPKEPVLPKTEKLIEKEQWEVVKTTPKSCDSPGSVCSFSSQQSHRSAVHKKEKSVNKNKKERKIKESEQPEQKGKHNVQKATKSKEEKITKHKVKKETVEEQNSSNINNNNNNNNINSNNNNIIIINNNKDKKSENKQQKSETSHENELTSSQVGYKPESIEYGDNSRQDECVNISQDETADWENSCNNWSHPPKQANGHEYDHSKYLNEATKLKHQADSEVNKIFIC